MYQSQVLTEFLREVKSSKYQKSHSMVVAIVVHFILQLINNAPSTEQWSETMLELYTYVDSRDNVRSELQTDRSFRTVLHCCIYEYIAGMIE